MRPNTVSYTRRTLTRAQAAEAAAQNVRGLGDIHMLATLAADLICDAGSGTRTPPPAIMAAMERRDVAIYAPLPSTVDCMPEGNSAAIRGYLLELASPSGNGEVLTWVVSDWLRDRLDPHTDALNDLRTTQPALYKALFAPTIRQAVRIGRRSNIGRAPLARLLADRARFILVGAAHDRIAHVRRIATSPYGRQFSGVTHWKSAAHVLLTTVVEPALVVEQVYRLTSALSKCTDEAVHKTLADKKLLSDKNAGAFVFRAALDARAIIAQRGVSFDQVGATLDRTVGPLAHVARITGEDVAQAGLARSSMSSLWFGLEPTELATYVAIELLKALNVVDALVEAALDGRKAAPADTAPSDTKAAFAATLLRYEGKSDRESLQIGRSRESDGGLDPGNKGSREPLATLKEKMRDPSTARSVARTFGIDANRLFQQ